jgi:hypothetical protein
MTVKPTICPAIADALGEAILADPRRGSARMSWKAFHELVCKTGGTVCLRGRRWCLVARRLNRREAILQLREERE